MDKKWIIIVAILISIGIVLAVESKVYVDYNFMGNSIYNATWLNATNFNATNNYYGTVHCFTQNCNKNITYNGTHVIIYG